MKNWKWFGNAGHLIVSDNCRFHLCTKVGKYLISTVGQYWPVRPVRQILAQSYDPKWLSKNIHLKGDYFDIAYMERFGFQEIGYNRTYETMVFRAGKVCNRKGCKCGMPLINGSELDSEPYNDTKSATEGHMKMCRKWSNK